MTPAVGELVGRRVVVEVPATSANLGAGYDCLGLALDVVNRIELEVAARPPDAATPRVMLGVTGEGADELRADPSNRFVRGLEAALATGGLGAGRFGAGGSAAGGSAAGGSATRDGFDGVGWRIAMRNRIPLARGLGSSAAASVGGVIAGDALLRLLGGGLSDADLLRLPTEIEGHPDNAAPALLGGFVVSAALDGGYEAIRFDVPDELVAVLFIPQLWLETKAMREILPSKVPRADAVANLGRVALGVAGLASGRVDLLRALTVDRLHEPYRASVFPQLPLLVAGAREAGALGACLSGAGSTVIAFAESGRHVAAIGRAFEAVAAEQQLPGRVEVVRPRNAGAVVLEAR